MNKEQILELLELIIVRFAKIPVLPILILFSIIGLGVGIFLIINPSLVLEIQKRFYEKINWRIEPISMSKEIRNTRFMGCFLILLLVAVLLFAFTTGLVFP